MATVWQPEGLGPVGVLATTPCFHLSECSGHGVCDSVSRTCTCYDGWGGPNDLATYKAPDCSLRTCPNDRAWVDIPTAPNTAHALAECSNMGICDRFTGKCTCAAGFEGVACERTSCPNDCSGHGRCVSLRQLSIEANAVPVGNSGNVQYGGNEATTTWDQDKVYGCVCDSTWAVGFHSGETQVPLWFGADCSKKHCPSADDPMTVSVVETNCQGKGDNGKITTGGPGLAGNLCHVDCANRGICDYDTGICNCFNGFYGDDCTLKSVLARQK